MDDALARKFVPVIRPDEVRFPIFPVVAKRLVLLAVPAKKFVVVAWLPVALMKVKFCKVEDPFERRFDTVASPVEVMFPTELIAVANRFVEEAVVANIVVVVALLDVEFRAVKLSRVEEPERRRFERDVNPAVAVRVPVKLAAEDIV